MRKRGKKKREENKVFGVILLVSIISSQKGDNVNF
jgi:hypothetical protein